MCRQFLISQQTLLDKDARCCTSWHVCACVYHPHTGATLCCTRSILLWPLIDNWCHHGLWLCTLTVSEEGRQHRVGWGIVVREAHFKNKKAHIWLLRLIFSSPDVRTVIGPGTQRNQIIWQNLKNKITKIKSKSVRNKLNCSCLMMDDGSLIDANVLPAKCCSGSILPALVCVPLNTVAGNTKTKLRQ